MERAIRGRVRYLVRVRESVAHPLIVLPLSVTGLVAGVASRSPFVLWATVAVVAGYSLSGSV